MRYDARFVNPKLKQTWLKQTWLKQTWLKQTWLKQMWRRSAHLVIAGLAALIATGDHADARGNRSERAVEVIEQRTAGEPVMAIVSLHSQRITVYDAQGWILRAPVSSGQKGRETPAGIFSVIQKEAEHYSNL